MARGDTEARCVEKPIVTRATAMGIMHRKMNGLGNRSWPDQMFTLAGPYTLFMECKLPGEEPSPLQWDKIQELRGLGYAVAVCDTKEDGWLCLRIAEHLAKLPKGEPGDDCIQGISFLTIEEESAAYSCFYATQEHYNKNHSKIRRGIKARGVKAVGPKSLPKAGASIHAQEPRGVRVGRPRSR